MNSSTSNTDVIQTSVDTDAVPNCSSHVMTMGTPPKSVECNKKNTTERNLTADIEEKNEKDEVESDAGKIHQNEFNSQDVRSTNEMARTRREYSGHTEIEEKSNLTSGSDILDAAVNIAGISEQDTVACEHKDQCLPLDLSVKKSSPKTHSYTSDEETRQAVSNLQSTYYDHDEPQAINTHFVDTPTYTSAIHSNQEARSEELGNPYNYSPVITHDTHVSEVRKDDIPNIGGGAGKEEIPGKENDEQSKPEMKITINSMQESNESEADDGKLVIVDEENEAHFAWKSDNWRRFLRTHVLQEVPMH